MTSQTEKINFLLVVPMTLAASIIASVASMTTVFTFLDKRYVQSAELTECVEMINNYHEATLVGVLAIANAHPHDVDQQLKGMVELLREKIAVERNKIQVSRSRESC